ncbi:META domain-containing protein [Zhouia sp. PK063]|uniref:META domain-containing protein n=1 Tax=Zhouia sp. PK063 TaxID=3373602 RepID=UPI00378922E7
MKKIYLVICLASAFISCQQKNKKENNTSLTEITSTKKTDNADFIARGNEPFWNLKIDFDQQMVFTSPNTNKITTPVPKPNQAQDALITNFKAASQNGSLDITITKQPCVDSMKGDTLAYKVTVRAKSKNDNDFTTFEGCGYYTGNYRLHDIWVLKTLNGKLITDNENVKMPNIELNLITEKVYGFGGCNRLTGNIAVTTKKLKFDMLATTKMSCAQDAMETEFLQAISGKTFEYNIKHLELTLKDEQNTLVFKKVD